MAITHWAIVAALLGIALPAEALQASSQAHATTISAATPTMAYSSAFAGYKPFSDADSPPDAAWRAANAVVQGQGGHGSHGKAVSPSAPSAPSLPDSAEKQAAGQRPVTPSPSQKGGHDGQH